MILYLQILLVAGAFLLPWAYTVKKARIEVTAGLSFMIGMSSLRTEYQYENVTYDRRDLLFCIGPINISATWLKKINA